VVVAGIVWVCHLAALQRKTCWSEVIALCAQYSRPSSCSGGVVVVVVIVVVFVVAGAEVVRRETWTRPTGSAGKYYAGLVSKANRQYRMSMVKKGGPGDRCEQGRLGAKSA
jgi:hypothetical protein